MRGFLLTTLLTAAALPAMSAPIRIVDDHKPRATIVVADDAPEALRDACQEMQRLIAASTGATLEIVAGAMDGLVAINVGPSGYVDGLELDLGDLDADGYVIAFPDAGNIVILGPTAWGTEFGVYEFLERYVGVRWLLPGADGVDVPEQATIDVPDDPVRDEPVFFSRLFSGLRGSAWLTWARRNRMHRRVEFHHNLIRLFPPETYTRTHPEFFPIKKGERFLPPTNDTHGWQPCFTAPGLVDEAIKNIVRHFDENPEAESYSLGVNDSGGHCECDNCRARDPGEKNFIGRDHLSDRYFEWANAVVEGVLKQHPDKFFGCLAYSEIAQPPDRVTVHERIIPYMTYDRMKWIRPDIRTPGEEMTKAWHAASPTVGWYDYIYGAAYCVPRVWFHHMGDYYRFGQANGVRAAYAEAYPNVGEGPKLYVSLKLQWDPERDVDELLDEWYERCVGAEAAGHLKAFYAHWEDFWTRRILDSAWFTEGGQYLRFYAPDYLADVAPEEAATSRGLLEAALAKTTTDGQRARAELLLRAFEYYEASILAYPRDAGDRVVDSEAKALQVVSDAVTALEMNEKRRRLQLEEFAKHPVLVHGTTMERRPTLAGQGWGAGRLWQAYDWVRRSEALRARLGQIVDAAEDQTVKDHVRTMLAVAEGTGENRVPNASFEDGDAAVPENWSFWVKYGTGSMKKTDELAHTGRLSILCDGMARGGPHQTLPFEPGRYAAVCFVYTPPGQESAGTVTLSITPRDAAHGNLPATQTMVRPISGRWQAVATAGEIPAQLSGKDVAELMVIATVDGFAPDEKIYVDDVTLLRLAE